MGLIKGGFLRLVQTCLYALAFCCAAIILGFYSYFLSVLSDRNLAISKGNKAVEGISGIAVVYTICGFFLTCCLAGRGLFAFFGIVLDVLFAVGFIALSVLTRHGASSCKGKVNTPFGSGNSNSKSNGFGSGGFGTGNNENATYEVNLGLACRMNKACFAVSIIGVFIFLMTAMMQVVIARRHKKEKALGPSPANNYTSGYGKGNKRNFWQRRKNRQDPSALEKEAGVGAAGGLAPHSNYDNRPSYDTGYTGSTVGNPHTTGTFKDAEPINSNYREPATTHAPHGAHGGYYTAPVGSDNPYEYGTTTTNNNIYNPGAAAGKF